jgi:hypothetical protein
MPDPIKTYDVDFKVDPSLPTSVWDPKWKKPEIATRVALHTYKQLRWQGEDFAEGPLPQGDLAEIQEKNTEFLEFSLEESHPLDEFELAVKGGGFGEIFRRYAFGAMSAVYFHAQAVCFGVDSQGRYFLQAQVGRLGGTWGKSAALIVRFLAGEQEIGALSWQDDLDPPKDVQLKFTGQDEKLRDSFEQLSRVSVAFYTYCPEP